MHVHKTFPNFVHNNQRDMVESNYDLQDFFDLYEYDTTVNYAYIQVYSIVLYIQYSYCKLTLHYSYIEYSTLLYITILHMLDHIVTSNPLETSFNLSNNYCENQTMNEEVQVQVVRVAHSIRCIWNSLTCKYSSEHAHEHAFALLMTCSNYNFSQERSCYWLPLETDEVATSSTRK